MKNNYVMDVSGEFERLETQNKTLAYNIFEDLHFLNAKKNERILDAGSGSGLLLREIARLNLDNELYGVDFSDIRVNQAIKESKKENMDIIFQKGNLRRLDFSDNFFDKVVCRFVYEYLEDPIAISNELKRILRPGGELILIDNDGVLFNIYTQNSALNSMLEILKSNLKVDLFVGRKLPFFLHQVGLKDVDWKCLAKEFKGSEKEAEKNNNLARFQFAKEALTSALGGEAIYNKFCETYISEMGRSETTLFMNKFLVKGIK